MIRLLVTATACGLFWASSAVAEPVQLSERAVAQQTLDHNPSVRAAVADLQASEQGVQAQGARYRPILVVEANGTRQDNPSLTPRGTIRMLRESLTLAAELRQTFSIGTTVAVRVEANALRSEGALFSGSMQSVELGPGYLYGIRLSATQPLLRALGTDVGLAELRLARLDRNERQRERDATASSMLSDALQAYWDLWYAQRTLEIERQARALALEQRDDIQRKVAAGVAAEVDLLTYETSLAELDVAVLDAEVAVEARAVDLGRTIGRTDIADLHPSSVAPPEIEAVDPAQTLARAQRSSYTIAQLEIALRRTQTAARTAADATRPRLDLTAWVQCQGLGNHSHGDALNQLATSTPMSAFVGVELELPLSSERHNAELSSAQSNVAAAQARLAAAMQQVQAATRTELATLEQARTKIALAERTVEVARRSADAQRKRLQHGAATPVEVRQAEDALRRARLAMERQRVDGAKAQIRLRHLTGSLLERWGSLLSG